jgi:1-acyl-sn-glycerol-3-phosphate acyltransferase
MASVRAADGFPMRTPELTANDAILGARRVAQTLWCALESLGRIGVATRGLDGAAQIKARAHRLREVCVELLAIHGIDVQVSGALPDSPSLLISNHLSYVDALVVCSLLPLQPLAKGEVAGWPLFGAAARAHGVVFVERGSVGSGAVAMRKVLRALASGISVAGFPEGTTSDGSDLLPFHRGLFGAARIAGVPIVPIAISYDSPEIAWVGDAWFGPHYLRTAQRRETSARVTIGSEIVPRPQDRPEDLAEAARISIRRNLARSA